MSQTQGWFRVWIVAVALSLSPGYSQDASARVTIFTCQIEGRPDLSPVTYEFDEERFTLDGYNARPKEKSTVETNSMHGGDIVTTTLDRLSGSLVASGDPSGRVFRGQCVPSAKASPAETPSPSPVTDNRLAAATEIYFSLLSEARDKRRTYLEAARQYREKFLQIYPEEKTNVYMNEYLAYMTA